MTYVSSFGCCKGGATGFPCGDELNPAALTAVMGRGTFPAAPVPRRPVTARPVPNEPVFIRIIPI